jgi:hypothetical protein
VTGDWQSIQFFLFSQPPTGLSPCQASTFQCCTHRAYLNHVLMWFLTSTHIGCKQPILSTFKKIQLSQAFDCQSHNSLSCHVHTMRFVNLSFIWGTLLIYGDSMSRVVRFVRERNLFILIVMVSLLRIWRIFPGPSFRWSHTEW